MRTEISVLGEVVSPTLREYALAKLTRLERFADIDILRAVVRPSDPLECRAEGTVHTLLGVTVNATARHQDKYAAVDSLYQKLKRQLSDRGRGRGRKHGAKGASEAPALPGGAPHGKVKVSHPVITVVWAPEAMSEFDYAEIVTALAGIVRDEGGIGVQRIRTGGCGIPLDSGVLA